jgi:diacylglycerol kinase family enzyme
MIEYAGHAREYVQNIQLSDWSGIVLASGDGLIYEVNHFRIIF